MTIYTHTYRFALAPLPQSLFEQLAAHLNGVEGGSVALAVTAEGYNVTFSDRSERRVMLRHTQFCEALDAAARTLGVEREHSVEVGA